MADRVHPRDSPPSTSREASGEVPPKPSHPQPQKPIPPPPVSGTYVVQVPKDQIYRYPPPENAKKYKRYTSPKPRRSCCCRCFCWTLCLLVVLVVALAVAAGVLYLVFRPEAPEYTVTDVAIRGLNLTSSGPITPGFDVTVRAENPNNKIGIYYARDSSVEIYYSDVNLCNGALPAFYQPPNNITLFQTALKGSDIILASSVKSGLLSAVRQKKVTFRLYLEAPVKIKVGAVKTWKITVKVKCDLTVDSLTAESKLMSKDCHYSVKLW